MRAAGCLGLVGCGACSVRILTVLMWMTHTMIWANTPARVPDSIAWVPPIQCSNPAPQAVIELLLSSRTCHDVTRHVCMRLVAVVVVLSVCGVC